MRIFHQNLRNFPKTSGIFSQNLRDFFPKFEEFFPKSEDFFPQNLRNFLQIFMDFSKKLRNFPPKLKRFFPKLSFLPFLGPRVFWARVSAAPCRGRAGFAPGVGSRAGGRIPPGASAPALEPKKPQIRGIPFPKSGITEIYSPKPGNSHPKKWNYRDLWSKNGEF